MMNHSTMRTHSDNSLWNKAAVIGSIWAGIEIVFGSFLHNLRIPFAGTLLSMTSVYLLVAFIQHWPERGIIIRAGIVASLLKSISPSAIILGPMIGILMEAILLELVWSTLGRNLAGYLLGGILAVSWSLAQKVLGLIILYGFDLVKIAEVFYHFLVRISGINESNPTYLVLIILGLYSLAGAFAACMGYITYKRLQPDTGNSGWKLKNAPPNNPFIENITGQRYAAVNLLLVILAVTGSLYFLGRQNYLVSLCIGIPFLGFILIRYRNATRKLKRMGIWIQLLLLTVITALLWEWIKTGKYFSKKGLIVGLEMNYRAFILILSFTAFSVELRNPLIRSILYRNGFSNVYKAVQIAFSILPNVMRSIPGDTSLLKKRRGIMSTIFNQADNLLAQVNERPPVHENIFLISGNIHSGKTTFLKKIITELQGKEIEVAGFYADGTFRNNRRDSYKLSDISTGNSLSLASSQRTKGWFKFKRFYFNPDAFRQGKEWVRKGLEQKADVIVLDEIGPLELSGKGWYPLLRLLAGTYSTLQIWVIREQLLEEITDRWQIPAENMYFAGDQDPEPYLDRMYNFLQQNVTEAP